MSEIKGGTMTAIVEGGAAHDVRFSSHGKLLLSVTRNGELLLGDGLSVDAATKEVGEMLVEHFGRTYGSALRAAEEQTAKAKDKAKSAEGKVREWEVKALRAVAVLEVKKVKTAKPIDEDEEQAA